MQQGYTHCSFLLQLPRQVGEFSSHSLSIRLFPKDAQAHPLGDVTDARVPRPLVSGDRVTRHLEAAGKAFSQEIVGLLRPVQP